ncbi:MAG: hypothetical protein CME05_02590 [Gemmatimonadaceae bacterium]|nr:hypothetical protein [Gemmatimonadaceae bacterium]
MWPDVLASLDHIGLHRAAASALVASGEQAVPTLIHALSDQERPVHVRSRIAAICGQLGGEAAVEALQLRMDSKDHRLCSAIIDALDRTDFEGSQAHRANIDDILWKELSDAT